MERVRDMVSIGKLADRYGVSPESLRVWERAGLIPTAHRTVGGHRRYGPEHVCALDRVMRADGVGEPQEVRGDPPVSVG